MRLKLVQHHGNDRWRVTWTAAGITRRSFFSTKGAADTFMAGLKSERDQHGKDWLAIPATARAMLVDCWRDSQAKGYSIPEALRFWEAHGSKTSSSVTVPALCDQFIAAKTSENLRPESLRLLKTTLKQFRLNRESQLAREVTTDEIRLWLANDEWGPWRRRGALIDINNMFNWSVQNGLMVRNPCQGIKRPKIDDLSPQVFTPDQCAELLAACRHDFPALLPYVCLCLFAGIRPAEVARLSWSDIKAEHIDLGAKLTKGRSRRLVTIRPALAAWLAVCKRGNGLVCPEGWVKQANELRARFKPWPRDVLRHCFVSYELARSKDIQATALEAGHSVEILFKHYRALISEPEAIRFWAIRP